MHYVLIDSNGSSLESWDDKDSALEALAEIAESEPGAAIDDLAVLACDDDGIAVERVDIDAMPTRH